LIALLLLPDLFLLLTALLLLPALFLLLLLLPNPALLRLRLARYLLWVLRSLLLLLLTALLSLSVLAFSLFAFLLLLFIFVLRLCVGERCDPEHDQQNSCADKSDFLHLRTSITG
jgi:hypothetical protein